MTEPADVLRKVAVVAGSVSVRIPPGWLVVGTYVRLSRRGRRVVLEPVQLVSGGNR
ncbi:MAG TPA: hypothetical protein VGX00_08520 [Thermoplasmata archaeon]|nr:hypothetical protein [Thermoplasmata archaeon]